MKIMIGIFVVIVLLLSTKIFVFAQADDSKPQIDVASLIAAARLNARRASWRHLNEYSNEMRELYLAEDGKRETKLYESLCGKRYCNAILVEHNGIALSAKKELKNRKQAVERLEKLDKTQSSKPEINEETVSEYGFTAGVYIEPGHYLKDCKADSPEKTMLNGRTTIKIHFNDCSIDKIPTDYKRYLEYMPKIQGWIWIDEADKNIVRVECFARKEFADANNANKPLIGMDLIRIADGFWLWSSIHVDAISNKQIFPEAKGDWTIELFDYKRFRVDINEPKIDKPQK